MAPSINKQKQALRNRIMGLRNALDLAWKKDYDEQINQHLISWVNTNAVKTVHAYLPIHSEIVIWPFLTYCLKNNVRVYCPETLANRKMNQWQLTAPDKIKKGLYGTYYPLSSHHYDGPYDLIVVPGVAFDHHLFRLGYGGGYYDSFLKEQKKGHQVGLAYPFQLVNSLPIEPHDAQLDAVLYV